MKKRKYNEVYGIEVKIDLGLIEKRARIKMLSDYGFPNSCVCGYYEVCNNILRFYMWRPCENTWSLEEEMHKYGFQYKVGAQYKYIRTRGESEDIIRFSDYIPNFRSWWAKNGWWFDSNEYRDMGDEKPSDYEYEQEEMGKIGRYTKSRSTIYDRVPTIATRY